LGYDHPDTLVHDVQNLTARTRAEFERVFNETESHLLATGGSGTR
jgi:hypothetical protein